MIQIVIFGAMAVLSLIGFGLGLYVLVLLFKEKGFGHALLGFFIAPYAYIWGWVNAKRLQMIDIMVVWTIITILAVTFPIVISIQEASKTFTSAPPASFTTLNDGDGSYVISYSPPDPVSMGSIQVGSKVNGEITDILETHNWTFNGTAGQTVTIQGKTTSNNSMAPRIMLFEPDDTLLTSVYGGEAGANSLISSITLPANGQYTIQINVWELGHYEIALN